MVVRDLHELETFTQGDNDQPTTCPKCSSRTDFIEIAEDKQQHKCLNRRCEFEFFLDLED